MNFLRNSIITGVFVVLSVFSFAQSKDFKAVQSLEIFHSLLRELSLFYVDSIEVEKLVTTGIGSMLESLDPYTAYIPEEIAGDFDIMLTGQYGGMGALIKKAPGGVVISEPYKGFPADKAGLVAGDKILEIDGDATADMDLPTASKRLKGAVGTTITLKVEKLRGNDTLTLTLTRDRIRIADVTYAGLLADSIGYIRLSSFTKDGSRDFKNAFMALQKTGALKKLVIDLRSNSGGSLDEAVNIVGLFVPRNTEVVASRGRIKQFDRVYKTKELPLDTEIPIAVLVNNLSASAAEIVAGSLQDLDRAVIIGSRTFGKGLVQTVRDLGYNAQLKITTAKYYIPSGRCIQAIDYSHRNADGSVGQIPDSLIRPFKTKNGRTVYDGGGITPDILSEPQSYAKITYDIAARDMLHDFSVRYFAGRPTIAAPEDFRLTDEEYNDFVQYAAGKPFDDRTTTELLLAQLEAAIKAEHLYDTAKAELDTLHAKISHDKRSKLLLFRPELQQLLENEICARYYYDEGRFRSMLRHDNQAEAAVNLLNDPEAYKRELGIKN
ncbi:MAG: S41 family peptidase [Prevotellaceae bacterium]|jgi:carboxyl-terminal processing protease|nr:S41 family peptidase [Prevotellaceae bacterium]